MMDDFSNFVWLKPTESCMVGGGEMFLTAV